MDNYPSKVQDSPNAPYNQEPTKNCPDCKGSGAFAVNGRIYDCETCEGSGIRIVPEPDTNSTFEELDYD